MAHNFVQNKEYENASYKYIPYRLGEIKSAYISYSITNNHHKLIFLDNINLRIYDLKTQNMKIVDRRMESIKKVLFLDNYTFILSESSLYIYINDKFKKAISSVLDIGYNFVIFDNHISYLIYRIDVKKLEYHHLDSLLVPIKCIKYACNNNFIVYINDRKLYCLDFRNNLNPMPQHLNCNTDLISELGLNSNSGLNSDSNLEPVNIYIRTAEFYKKYEYNLQDKDSLLYISQIRPIFAIQISQNIIYAKNYTGIIRNYNRVQMNIPQTNIKSLLQSRVDGIYCIGENNHLWKIVPKNINEVKKFNHLDPIYQKIYILSLLILKKYNVPRDIYKIILSWIYI